MKIQIKVDGRITSYRVEHGDTIDLTVKKPLTACKDDAKPYALFDADKHVKPLLADAKVNDYAERRDGKIVQIKSFADSLYFCDDEWFRDNTGAVRISKDKRDIIRLIPQNTPEWQELHTAELLAKYPDIERDLYKTKNGDTLLFSNGETRIAESSDGEYLINSVKAVTFVNGINLYTWNKSDGKHSDNKTPITCLGIIARSVKSYSFNEMIAYLESKPYKHIFAGRPDYRKCYMDREGCLRFADDDSFYPVDTKDRNATDWVVVNVNG